MRDITLRGIFIIACVVLSTGIDSFLVDASIGPLLCGMYESL